MSRPRDPLLIDLESLLAPISSANPCGEWLRYDGTYEQIRDARREDDAGVPQGVWQTELKRADWGTVEELCAGALAHRSKDLQLAAWLLEAWIQLDSFAGAARGIELMRRLCDAFWEDMYPALEADMTPRLAPVQWVNDKLSRRLRLLRLTQPAMEGIPAYSLADWDAAMRNPASMSQSDGVTMAKFQQSVSLTSYQWFVALRRDVLETIEHIRAFDEMIDEKAAKLAPGLIKLRTEASSVAQLLDTMVEATRIDEVETVKAPETPLALGNPPGQDEPSLAPAQASWDAATPAGANGLRIRTRAEAYSLLEEIALFLQQNDPHSPTPYLIWRAVSWGEMHFNQLLPELIRDNADLNEIVKLLCLDRPQPGKY